MVGYDYQIEETIILEPQRSPQPAWKLKLLGKDLLHNAGLVEIRGLPSSERTLRVRSGNALFPHIRHLPGLWGLRLFRVAVNRDTVDRIAEMDNLTYLAMYAEPPLTEAEVVRLTSMQNLRELELYGRGITDACVKAVSRMSKLEGLRLMDASISDVGLAAVGRMTQLKALQIMGHSSHITDAGIAHLHGLTHLEHLLLNATGMSREGAAGLRAALADTPIETLGVRLPQQDPAPAFFPATAIPQLELITWIHDPPDTPRDSFDGIYWRPNGETVPNSDPLVQSLFGFGTIHLAGRQAMHPQLNFLFTHRDVMLAPTASLSLSDMNGNAFATDLRPLLTSQATLDEPGWMLFEHVVYPSLNVDAPLAANLRLEFASGRWRAVHGLNTSDFPREIVRGIHLMALGDDPGGRAFAVVAIDPDETIGFEYAVLANGPDGALLPPVDRPQLPRTGQRDVIKTRPAALVYRFARSLAEYADLSLCRRPRMSLEIRDVSLRPGTYAFPKVVVPRTGTEIGYEGF